MSGKERQARWKQRLREAANGVTPEMVREATRILYEAIKRAAEEPSDWPAYVASCHKKRGGNRWDEMVPDDIRPDAYDLIEDAADRALVERIAQIGHAVKFPPPLS